MERLSIIPGGLSSASVYEDGAADMQSNLRRKGGALRPVLRAGNAADGQLRNREYSLLYECHFDDDKDIIGVYYESNGNSTVYLVFRQEAGGEWQMYRNALGECNGKVTGIHQTGRILAVVTQDSLYYAIRKDDNYVWLGKLPELPEITFTLENSESRIMMTSITPDNISDFMSEASVEEVTGLFNEYGQEGAYLNDAHLIRWAFRLYDGNISKPSGPVMLCPITEFNESYEWLPFKVIVKEPTGGRENYPTLLRDRFDVKMAFDFTYLEPYKDIIKSVDFFLSLPIGYSNTDRIKTARDKFTSMRLLDADEGKYAFPLNLNGLKSDTEDVSTFYLLRSIPIGQEWNEEAYDPPSTGNVDTLHLMPSTIKDYQALQNLEMQELLDEGTRSNHTYGGVASYYYNGRLHLADIRTTMPDHFAHSLFSMHFLQESAGSEFRYVAEAELMINGKKEVARDSCSFTDANPLRLQPYISYPDPMATRLNVYEVAGDAEPAWNMLWSFDLKPHPFLDLAYYVDAELLPIEPNAPTSEIISQPANAFAPVVIRDPNKIKASAVDNPLSFPAAHTYTAGNGTVLALQSNAMDVSARNFGTYPVYVFATDGIYLMQVGDGETAYSSVTPLTSTEYPTSGVVCVTPAGVAFVGSRGLCMVSAAGVQQLTPMVELPWPEVQLELDYRLPLALRTRSAGKKAFNDYLKGISRLLYNPHENELIVSSDGETYDYVLQLGSGLLWENTEKAGVPVENHYPELWTLEATNKAMKFIKDWSLYQEDSSREVVFLTRPMRLGTDDVKRLARMVVRGTLYGVSATEDGKRPTVCLWMSNDGVHFKLLRGLFYKDLSRRDMDLGMLARSKGRYFVLGFCLSVTGETEIRMIEAEAEKQYNNLKMR